ncbi:MAG TPA: S9 family peptidase [Candidatus Dormibacteraeota bacterium]|nr:S9 family peptidase [Candidatus Dormibacteraeota bacterium]
MKQKIGIAGLAIFLVASASLNGQEKKTTEESNLLVPEDFLKLRGVQDPQFSPDGTRVAFVATDPLTGQHRTRHIWMYDLKSKSAWQFTYSEKSESTPRWSPDGKQLAFLSNRGEEQQIYLMRVNGGEAAELTKGKGGVENFAWAPDGKQIAFLSPDAKTEEQEKKEKDKDDSHVADKDERRPRLRILDLATKEERALTKPNWEIKELQWSPQGKFLTVVATDKPESDSETDRIFLVNAADGAMKQMLAPRGGFGNIQIAATGTAVAFRGCREDGPNAHDLMLLRVGESAAQNLSGANLDRFVQDFRWLPDGRILLSVLDGFRFHFAIYNEDGSRSDFPALVTNPRQFAVSTNGSVAFTGETTTEAQELWIWNRKDAPEQVTHLNDKWAKHALAKPDIYKYKSFDGLEVEAALLKPADWDGKTKLPLIAYVHGGPTGAWIDSVDAWSQLLAARGFAVFMPNIRGSLGYGHKFIEMNRADWGGADFKDVMAGVHDLVSRGIADPNRLGIAGWSYGGYMSEWAITQTNEFKGAVSGAGMANLISEFGTEQGPAYDEWFWGVPYEKPEGFLNHSPFLFLKKAKTPTLILQGENDPVDPVGQSEELYRGLKRYGVVADLVLYPREPHGFQEAKHRVDVQKRMVAWLEKYVKNAGSQTASNGQ